MARFVILLSALSGICGIGYELLLIRWLHTAVGHTVAVSAATVTTFLAGIALGALVAHRVAPKLGRVEALGALTAALIAAFILVAGVTGLTALVAPTGVPGAIAFAIIVSLPLAVVSGIAVPAYAARLSDTTGRSRPRAFLVIYIAYNAISALCAVLIETALVPDIGLGRAFALLAAVNLVLAFAAGRLPIQRAETMPSDGPPPAWPVLAALLVAGVGSGLGQIGIMKLGNLLFGYHAEHAAFAIALALLGLSLGALVTLRRRLATWVLVGLCAASLGAWSEIVQLWSTLAPELVGAHPAALAGAKIVILACVAMPFLIAVGAGIPLVLARAPGGPATPGRLVALAAIGNVIGTLAAVLGIHALFGVAGLITAGFLAAGATLSITGDRIAAALVVAFALSVQALQPAGLHLAAHAYTYPDALTLPDTVKVQRAWDKTVALVQRDDQQRIVIEGRDVMQLGQNRIGRGELIKGLFALSYARDHEKALVIGLGSSHTAAPVVAGFGHTVIVDNSPVPRLLRTMVAPEIRAPFQARDPEIVYNDAVAHLRADTTTYDVVVHTGAQGTSPSVKLWARETIQAMADRLEPDGVFVTWVSGFSHPRKALPASMSALGDAFSVCRMVRMTAITYHALVCRKDEQALRPADFAAPESLQPALARIGIAPADADRLVRGLDRGRVTLFPEHRPLAIDPPWAERVMARRDFFTSGPTLADSGAWLSQGRARTPEACWAEIQIDPESRCLDTVLGGNLCAPARRDVLTALAETALSDGNVAGIVRAVTDLRAMNRGATARRYAERAAREIHGSDPETLASLGDMDWTRTDSTYASLESLGLAPWRINNLLKRFAFVGASGYGCPAASGPQ